VIGLGLLCDTILFWMEFQVLCIFGYFVVTAQNGDLLLPLADLLVLRSRDHWVDG
jgi:hypothetical protein